MRWETRLLLKIKNLVSQVLNWRCPELEMLHTRILKIKAETQHWSAFPFIGQEMWAYPTKDPRKEV